MFHVLPTTMVQADSKPFADQAADTVRTAVLWLQSFPVIPLLLVILAAILATIWIYQAVKSRTPALLGTITVDGRPLSSFVISVKQESSYELRTSCHNGQFAAIGVPTGPLQVIVALSTDSTDAGRLTYSLTGEKRRLHVEIPLVADVKVLSDASDNTKRRLQWVAPTAWPKPDTTTLTFTYKAEVRAPSQKDYRAVEISEHDNLHELMAEGGSLVRLTVALQNGGRSAQRYVSVT